MNKISHSKTTLHKSDEKAILSIFRSGYLTSGDKAVEFSKYLGNYLNEDKVLLYSSGSSALYNILRALRLDSEDEILIPNYICRNVWQCVFASGGKPVVYDNAKVNWISSIKEISNCITPKTRAIVINHTFGIFNETIKKLKNKNIFLIEDCCHLLTTPSNNFQILKYSDAGFFSFNATKLLAMGEGGAVVTKNKELFKELCKIKIDHSVSDISAGLGTAQLKRYNDFLKRRRDIANAYNDFFDNFEIEKNTRHSVYFRYTIKVPEKIQKMFLSSRKVFFKKGVDDLLIFNKTEHLANSRQDFLTTVSLPIYPMLKKSEIKVILEETKRIFNA